MIGNLMVARKIRAAVAVVAVVAVGGFIHTAGYTSFLTGSADPLSVDDATASETLPERYPSFEMTRTVVKGSGTEVWQLVYTNHATWKLTLISSTSDPSRVGDYEALRDRGLTFSDLNDRRVARLCHPRPMAPSGGSGHAPCRIRNRR